jgi:TonB family protein
MRAAVLIAALWVAPGSPAAAQAILTPGDSVSRPVPLTRVNPVYPEELQAARVGGTVRVSLVVETDGSVAEARVVRGVHPVLDAETLRAARAWRFRPARQYGDPVRVRVEIDFGFAMRGPVYDTNDDGVALPVPIARIHPAYPAEALDSHVEGAVIVEGVVLPDGTVGATRVVAPLEPALDEEALRALKGWRFRPGSKDGIPVAVRVQVEMRFSLRR